MPASRTTIRPSALAHVEHAGDQPARPGHEEPTGLDRQAGRSPVGRKRVEQRRQLAGEPLRPRADVAERRDREPAADVERVELRQAAAQQGHEGERAADGIAPGIDGPELRADMEVDAAPPERSIGSAAGLDRSGDLVIGQAELRRAGTDRQAALGLGLDRRVEPEQDVEPGATGPPGDRREGSGLIGRLDRQPAQGSPAAAARTAARRSASVLPTPSSVIRAIVDAGPSSDGPFAARHDVGAEAQADRAGRRSRTRRSP